MNQFQRPVYIIIPVHDRKQITLKCLDNLHQQGVLQSYYVVVIDDGSTDGTAEAISSLYSEVIVLKGDGNLWWTGAIKKGMQYAFEKGAEFIIWLNDDCYPQPGAIDKLITLCQSDSHLIVGGQSLDPDTYQPSYGGIISKVTTIQPINTINRNLMQCDGLAGNFVCLPRQVLEDIGYPNEKLFPQYYGDVVYTHRAKNQQYKLLINGEAIALCKNDHPVVSWLIPNRPLFSYWREYFKIKSPFYWKAELNYYKEMLGWLGISLYLYQRILKFWLFFLINFTLPFSIRHNLQKNYRNLFKTHLEITE